MLPFFPLLTVSLLRLSAVCLDIFNFLDSFMTEEVQHWDYSSELTVNILNMQRRVKLFKPINLTPIFEINTINWQWYTAVTLQNSLFFCFNVKTSQTHCRSCTENPAPRLTEKILIWYLQSRTESKGLCFVLHGKIWNLNKYEYELCITCQPGWFLMLTLCWKSLV